MKGLTFHGRLDVRHEDVADPRLERPGDAIVRVSTTAICGSDLHVYHQRETGIEPGTVMGHEFVGEVVEIGADVERLAVGDRVVSPFTTSCGACFYCRRGLTCRCEDGQLFGWIEEGRGLHGAQAELVRVPLADSTLVKPSGEALEAPEEEVLLAGDVLATGAFAADLGGVSSDSVVAVVGCGPVGLMAVVACVERQARRIFAVDRVAERLELARGFGAEPVRLAEGNTTETGNGVEAADVVATVAEATGGRGADVVLEAVGSPQATRLAVELARPGGTIAAVGVHTEETFAFSPVEAYDKNLTYRAGRCPARHYLDAALELVASGRYDFGAVVSHRMPLAAGSRGYEIFDCKLDGCTKVVLTP